LVTPRPRTLRPALRQDVRGDEDVGEHLEATHDYARSRAGNHAPAAEPTYDRAMDDSTSSTGGSSTSQRGGAAVTVIAVCAVVAVILLALIASPFIKAFISGLSSEPKANKMFGESRVDTTMLKLKKYAFEAYPSWSTAHPDKGCPEKLSDLNEYMNNDDSNDSWGKPLKMYCGQNLPAGAKGIAVLSTGEDGKEGTPDDLHSWD